MTASVCVCIRAFSEFSVCLRVCEVVHARACEGRETDRQRGIADLAGVNATG